MSGTSLDGIDVALIRTDGENIVERGPSQTYAYSDEQRNILLTALEGAKTLQLRYDRPPALAKAEAALTDWHAQAVQDFLKASPAVVDVIGFHGQTVIHRPEFKLTVQLGDGQALANKLNLPVVYDLRAADVAAGGQGAPLVPVYHRALANARPCPDDAPRNPRGGGGTLVDRRQVGQAFQHDSPECAPRRADRSQP